MIGNNLCALQRKELTPLGGESRKPIVLPGLCRRVGRKKKSCWKTFGNSEHWLLFVARSI